MTKGIQHYNYRYSESLSTCFGTIHNYCFMWSKIESRTKWCWNVQTLLEVCILQQTVHSIWPSSHTSYCIRGNFNQEKNFANFVSACCWWNFSVNFLAQWKFWHIRVIVNTRTYTIVSQVSAHGCSTINPHFSPYWALARSTGRLQCATIEKGGIDYYYGRGAC